MTIELTTHVLDIAEGMPASGVPIELWSISPGAERARLAAVRTDARGRTTHPLSHGLDLVPGEYDLVFKTQEYFSLRHPSAESLVERVTVRLVLSYAVRHYHVPLLISPWMCTVYRGS